MKTLFILSPLSQFEVTSLIGLNAPILGHLNLTIFIGVTILALSIHGIKFFSFFIPAGTPLALVPLLVLIELISYLARAVSLGVRLFANLVAGHTLLKILSTYLYDLFTGSLIIAIITLIPFTIFL